MLLPLNCVHVALNDSKNLSLGDDIYTFFLLEYSCQQIMALLWFLAWHQFIIHFLPSWIAGEGDEEIRTAIVSHIYHGILSALMHVVGTTCEIEGKMTNWPTLAAAQAAMGIIVHGIPEVNII